MAEQFFKRDVEGRSEQGQGDPVHAPWRRPLLKSTLVSKPALHGSAVAYVEDVLRSGWWGYGPVAQHLQATVEALYEREQNVLATSSCTAAMHLALRTAEEVARPAAQP